eukprot:m.298263 g.298263  ORF g.298263 m.298263 type:complete len:59 (-) comp13819_c0_seq1:2315-2491(-)
MPLLYSAPCVRMFGAPGAFLFARLCVLRRNPANRPRTTSLAAPFLRAPSPPPSHFCIR